MKNEDRVILHCDCNGFFASVEAALNPALKNIPMAVGGDEKSRHGIILAKNELAKKYGVKTAETIWQAKKKCPDLVVVPPHHGLYEEFSEKINRIYEGFTDLVEPFGIDESWLDVTGSVRLFGSGKEIADKLRKLVYEQVGVTISVGVSFNKIYAKLGSDYKKPDATTVISRENYKEIVFPLPASDMLYVGKATLARLNSMGVHTIGDIVDLGAERLTKLFGKSGTELYKNASGEGDSEVASFYAKREVKSVGKGTTFSRDIISFAEARPEIIALSDNVATRMRKGKLKCRGVAITVKDSTFNTITRQKMLKNPTNLSRVVADTALELLGSCYDFRKPVRMLTVTAINTENEENSGAQLSFFEDEENERLESIEKSIDKIREKYGKNIIKPGGGKTLRERDEE